MDNRTLYQGFQRLEELKRGKNKGELKRGKNKGELKRGKNKGELSP